jgi:transglutaminase-like putative cysteine protease
MVRRDASAAVFVERFFQFSLLGLVASGYLAVAGSGYLDAPTIVLTAAGLVLRGLAVAGVVRLDVPERAAALAALGCAAFFPLDYFLLSRSFLTAVVHLVFFLAVVKILSSKTARDDLYMAMLAFLELLAAALLSIDLNFFLFLALFLLFSIAALTSGEIRRSIGKSPATARGGLRRFHARLGALSAMVALGILALTAGLFFVLPRTADAAFAQLMAHRILAPGFVTQVTLGRTGEIPTSSRPVMHIRIWRREVSSALKWRGAALTEFDGKRWFDPDRRKERIPVDGGHVDLSSPGPPGRLYIDYDVQLEALDSPALFFAGTPQRVDVSSRSLLRSDAGGYQLEHPLAGGIRYSAYSLLEEPPETSVVYPAPVLPLAEREQNLEHPPLDRRIPELARSLSAGAATDLERARDIERRLRADYTYSLDLPKREPADPLADFLFNRRKGYCEYFASAMAVMLRTLGIPARLATGFQNGLYNPMTDLWVVRASDAHSWVEAWIPGHGWTTFDPTPPDPSAGAPGLLSQLGLYLDAAQTFWQDWVVSYDMGRQGTLANRMEQGARRAGIRWFDVLSAARAASLDAAGWLRRFGPGLLALALAAAAIRLIGPRALRLAHVRLRVKRARSGQAVVADATLLYERMLRSLRRRGYQKPAWFTPSEFAASLPANQLGAAVTEFTMVYNALRFGGRTDVAPRLSALLDELARRDSRL